MPRPSGILLEFVSSVVLAKDVMDHLLTCMAISWVTQSIAKGRAVSSCIFNSEYSMYGINVCL